MRVQGRQADADVLWHYYLIAGPEGDQVIGIFTLGLAQQARFGDQDLRLIGSLEWKWRGSIVLRGLERTDVAPSRTHRIPARPPALDRLARF